MTKIKPDNSSTIIERGLKLPPRQSEIDRYLKAGHSLEWINWWLDFQMKYPRGPMSTTRQAKIFITSMSGPAASKFAKKHSQLRLFK